MLKAGGLALLLGSAAPQAVACAFDSPMAAISPAHPGSVAVALAIFDAYESRLVRKPPGLPGAFGMRRAQGITEKLKATLGQGDASIGFNLLMVESGLWTRYQPEGGTLQMTAHVLTPADDEAVVITGEGVLMALERGRLSVEQAMSAGLLRIEASEQERREIARNWLQAPFSGAGAN